MTAGLVALAMAVAAATAAAMEPWAALLHARLWHGAWWRVHQSHHACRGDVAAAPGAPRARAGLELNDLMSLMHAPPAAFLTWWGLAATPSAWAAVALGLGGGMTLFGAAYLVVHDGLVHRRLPVAGLLRLRYFRRVLAAHTLHHRGGGPPFGLFAGPWRLPQRRT